MVWPAVERALAGALDRRAVGHGVGERHAELDHVDAGGGEAAEDGERGVVVGVAGHDEGDEGLAARGRERGEPCFDACHAAPASGRAFSAAAARGESKAAGAGSVLGSPGCGGGRRGWDICPRATFSTPSTACSNRCRA